MNLLILTVTAGHGHNQTAKAISDYAQSHGHNAPVVDAIEYINPLLKDTLNRAYLFSTSVSPKAYGTLYNIVDNKEASDWVLSPQNVTTALLSKKIVKFIKSFNPDAIICTHVFAALLISDLKEKGITAPTFGIVTDYTLHPYWNDTDIDYYVIPNEYLNYQTIGKGIAKEKILPFGIPIHAKFNKKMNKDLAREILNIENKPTILMMSGSMGYGNMIKLLDAVCSVPLDFQIVTVCGNNKSLKKKIDNGSFSKKVYNYGFTDKVDTMMDAADLIITKPGGLTVSEALAKELPMVLTNPIPGHEFRNREFLVNMGAAAADSKTYFLDEIVAQLFENPKRLELMKESIRLIKKPDAAKTLIDFIESKK
ncbi:MAG: glycosyltransferase [Ruminococcaceae bacterium]|nr:glycosyltransferase [Oscillospiraceae bacterium]